MMKELIFKNDPYEMNWVRPDFPYGEVGVPEELSATSASVREGDVVRTEIRIKNEGKKPYFTNIEDIRISFPVPDQYEDSKTSLIRRCHTHLFCGKDVSWICALRMGGEAPHLGMVASRPTASGGIFSARAMTAAVFICIPKAWSWRPGRRRSSAG